MPRVIEDAYEKYMEKVRMALHSGYSPKSIIEELLRERATIMPRCVIKQATLMHDRNMYKKREAARSAHECLTAIERIIKELEKENVCADSQKLF